MKLHHQHVCYFNTQDDRKSNSNETLKKCVCQVVYSCLTPECVYLTPESVYDDTVRSHYWDICSDGALSRSKGTLLLLS